MNEDLTVAPEPARVRDWSETVVLALNPPDRWLMMLPMSFSVEEKGRIAAAALEDLVEVVATYGFGDRLEVEDSVALDPWPILDGSIWSLTPPRIKRISGSKQFRSLPQKDFFNTIRQLRSFAHRMLWNFCTSRS